MLEDRFEIQELLGLEIIQEKLKNSKSINKGDFMTSPIGYNFTGKECMYMDGFVDHPTAGKVIVLRPICPTISPEKYVDVANGRRLAGLYIKERVCISVTVSSLYLSYVNDIGKFFIAAKDESKNVERPVLFDKLEIKSFTEDEYYTIVAVAFSIINKDGNIKVKIMDENTSLINKKGIKSNKRSCTQTCNIL